MLGNYNVMKIIDNRSSFKLRNFFAQGLILSSFLISLLLNLALWVIIYFYLPLTSQTVVVRYNVYFGADALTDWANTFLFPIIGLGVLIINFLLAFLVWQREKILAFTLVFASVIIEILFIIIGSLIILINQ